MGEKRERQDCRVKEGLERGEGEKAGEIGESSERERERKGGREVKRETEATLPHRMNCAG